MRSIIVSDKQNNMKLTKVIKESFPNMPVSALYKALRKKDIKIDGIRVKEDCIVYSGNKIDIYIIDEILMGAPIENSGKPRINFTVVYEDRNILIVNKEQGVPVHPDRKQAENTLIDQVKQYLIDKGEYYPRNVNSFPPSLCHRLDRNTGGLVIIAKNRESLKIMLDKIKKEEIKKYYLCLVKGQLEKKQGELKAYLMKDQNKSRVFISEEKKPGYQEIITRYKILSYEPQNDVSKLEVELVTGRTHQIRAHLAHIGHPIIGDGKYGTNDINRMYKVKYQALWAYKLYFDFKGRGMLDYLKGKKFEIQPDIGI
ncbi:MAG TPA: RluA family pseudouridine synthase [Clostridiaceae bacterium]|nr:RluA family pseudouridine synthase [Clostridiaceae bacterium]